jgi:DNA adenine methylase
VTIAGPFLKWAGGKHRVVSELLKIVDEEPPLGRQWNVDAGSRYHEPFLGSGAMFFGLKDSGFVQTKRWSYLSDINPALINTMQVVSDDRLLEHLIETLESWQEEYGREGPVPKHSTQAVREEGMYYRKRQELNRYLGKPSESEDTRVEFAALSIFLNKTCFNGLWRMNGRGLFNVPEGDYVKPQNICQKSVLLSCNKLLKRTKIERVDWKDSMKRSKPGDLVYLDPPYMPLKIDDQVFNSYYTDGFDFEDQRELALAAAAAASRGVRVIASNHDALGEPTVREIYGNSAVDVGCEIDIEPIQVGRNISCKGHGRVKVNEVLIFMGPQ